MRTVLLARPAGAVLAIAALGTLGICAPAAASAARPAAASGRAAHAPHRAALVRPSARPKLPAGERYVCPAPTRPGQMTCMSIIRTGPGHRPSATAPAVTPRLNGFYTPADLRSAYKLAAASARGGKGRTVAIVDAFSDPNAAHDLGVYRSHYHLPACTTASGCLKIVNEHGQKSPLPGANASWALEESLDLDMVSAICPNCHILLVEAASASTADLGTAEDAAVAKGAKYVSNSWSGGEFVGQDFFDHYFNHPGVVIDIASGDFGYGPAYPTDLQYVTAIGGTSLKHAGGSRGWTESAWGSSAVTSNPEGTGSGCSTLAVKASWQRADATEPDGCLNRTENDVSAVADPNTGVVMYDTYRQHGFFEIGGTSAATPIITATYALAGSPTKNTYPAEYPYLHSSHLFDVTSGANGQCESFRQYLCHGKPGYDGPTGLGTPDGTAAFTDGGAHRVTVLDPGTQDAPAGATVSLTIRGLDTGSVSSLSYNATGLPTGLSIAAVPHSTNAGITGTLFAADGDYPVTVTAKDGSVTGTTHFTFAVVPTLDRPSPVPAEVSLNAGTQCLDANGGGLGASVKVQPCVDDASQKWQYTSDGNPDSTGNFTIGGLCLGLSGTDATLVTCATGAASQEWVYLGTGALGNLSDGGCLAAASLSAGAQAEAASCTFGSKQTWWLPGGPLVAGTSLCTDDPGASSTPGTQVTAADCAGSGEQQWSVNGDGTISSDSGLCLSGDGSLLSGSAAVIEICDSTPTNPDFSQIWIPGPGGELINAGSGRCLADPGNGGNGTGLTQEDCYGEVGELWGLN